MSYVNLGVTDQTPTVAKLLTVAPDTSGSVSVQHIPVPLGILDRVVVFTAPGCNYSVGVGIGFNGKKFIPTEDESDWIYGPGFQHNYPAGWQVQNEVDVFFYQENRIQHRIYVGLYIDRRPTQRTSGSNLIVPT